jgi:carboxyl-terminal processing protease
MNISLFSSFLKRANVVFIWLLLIAQIACAQVQSKKGADKNENIMPQEEQVKISMLLTNIFSNHHYRKLDLNDSLSSSIFDAYLQTLDNNKLYFLASDIKEFEKYRYTLDDDLKRGNLVAAFHIYNVFKKRVIDRNAYLSNLLDEEKPFDFTKDEYFEADREKASWPKNEAEWNELWRKQIKHQALSLKLTGKEWAEAKKTLKSRFDNLEKALVQYSSEDVFQLYMNAFAESYDPHTSYFSPTASENFEIEMSQSLEGIGATLKTENDYTKIVELIVGGPAFKCNKLHKDDKIIGVAQGKDGEMVDVIGWRIDKVVKLIRGPKGTVVRLQILEAEAGANAVPKEVEIVREKIKLEEQSAKKEVYEINHNNKTYKLGVITVPVFYMDFKDAQKKVKDYKSTTRDVRKLLKELEAENIDGLVVDLRNNGGGSLREAIDLSGLFIPEGPVVQIRHSNGYVEVERDLDPAIVYSGPLAVMVNRFSASASEIFAGAIQDYKRGVIIGEQTYGKGTVQNLLDLDRLLPQEKNKMGQVKITIAKFYRVSGSSTQHKGVTPDIELPSIFSADEFGESSYLGALPWDQIQATPFKPANSISEKTLNKLNNNYQKRLKTDPVLKKLVQDAEEIKEARKNTKISLNEEKRRKEMNDLEEKKAALKKNSFDIDTDEKESKEKSKEDKLKKDTYLREGLIITSDYISLIK